MRKFLVGLVAVFAVLSFAAYHDGGILSIIWNNLETISASGSVTAFGFYDGRFFIKVSDGKENYYTLIPLRALVSKGINLKIGEKVSFMGKVLKGKRTLVIPTQVSLNSKILDLITNDHPRAPLMRAPEPKRPGMLENRRDGKPMEREMLRRRERMKKWIEDRGKFFKLVWDNLPSATMSGRVLGIVNRDGRLFLKISSGSEDIFVVFPAMVLANENVVLDENATVQVSGKRLASNVVIIVPEKISINGKEFNFIKSFEKRAKEFMRERRGGMRHHIPASANEKNKF